MRSWVRPLELLDSAERLLAGNGEPPTNCDMRRAQSAAYYALFHCLARNAADMLVGGEGVERSEAAWLQVYRALNHNTVFTRCEDVLITRFPDKIQDFGYWFKNFQLKRHDADYDPVFVPEIESIHGDLELARSLIEDFDSEGEKHRRAFAAYLIIERRTNDRKVKRPRPTGPAPEVANG